jgi:hypothetical protein
MKTIHVKWTGIRPLLMNNGLQADPLNPNVLAKKEITDKGKKMTVDDQAKVAEIKFFGALYLGEDGTPCIPSDNIERCVQLGAQKNRKGKDVEAAVLCRTSEVRLDYDGPRKPDELYAKGFLLKKGVVIQRRRVMGVRPMIPPGWTLDFELEFDETVINQTAILKAMEDAGSLVGLGDWRPKFGRFLSETR